MKLVYAILAFYAVAMIIAVGDAVVAAPRDGVSPSLADRVAALETRLAEVERQCGCQCEPAKAATSTQPAKKRLVWHPPRPSRDEDENLPGYWEEVD